MNRRIAITPGGRLILLALAAIGYGLAFLVPAYREFSPWVFRLAMLAMLWPVGPLFVGVLVPMALQRAARRRNLRESAVDPVPPEGAMGRRAHWIVRWQVAVGIWLLVLGPFAPLYLRSDYHLTERLWHEFGLKVQDHPQGGKSLTVSVASLDGLGPLLHRIQDLRRLEIEYCSWLVNLEALSGLSSVTELSLEWCDTITDLSVLSTMSNLAWLNVAKCGRLTELDVGRGYQSLRQLDVTSCRNLVNVVGLDKAPLLANLKISDCDDLSRVEKLNGHANLNRVEVSDGRLLTSLDVSGCPNLNSLIIANCEALATVNVSGADLLDTIQLSDCRSLKSVNGLSRLPRMSSIMIASTGIVDYRPLSELSTLLMVGVPCNRIPPHALNQLRLALPRATIWDSERPVATASDPRVAHSALRRGVATAMLIVNGTDRNRVLRRLARLQWAFDGAESASTTWNAALECVDDEAEDVRPRSLLELSIVAAQFADFDKAVATAMSIESPMWRALALGRVAEWQGKLGFEIDGVATVRAAEQATSFIADPSQRASTLLKLADSWLRLGDVEAAGVTCNAARDAALSLPIPSPRLSAIAEVQMRIGDTEGALESVRLGHSEFDAWLPARIAQSQAAMGEIEEAIATARSIVDAEVRDQTLCEIAGVQILLADVTGARATCELIALPGPKARALCAIALINRQHGDPSAVRDIVQAVRSARLIPPSGDCVTAWINIANTQIAMHLVDDVPATLDEARRAAELTDPAIRDQYLPKVIDVLASAGFIDEALAYSRLIEDPIWRGDALRDVADAMTGAGRLLEATGIANEEESLYARANMFAGIVQGELGLRNISVDLDESIP